MKQALPIRILVVEDDEDDFLLLRACIRDIPDQEFSIDWCHRYEEALGHFSRSAYDLYFVDYLLGGRTGLELLQDAMDQGCDAPIVLLTGIGKQELDIEAMNRGAVDYLVKSEISAEKLERCIRYSMERSSYLRAMKTNLKKIGLANLQIEKLRSTATLLRTLAHEVRNPLTNINLSVEQLRPLSTGEGAPSVNPEEAAIYLDIIARNCARIDGIISELLNLSRPAEIFLQKASLEDIMNNTLAAASDRIALKGIHIDLHYPRQPSFVLADTEKLKIAFLNIIINAVEAVPHGSGRITVSISGEPPVHRLWITDNGHGIPEENISRIFEPYFTSKSDGFGLGLAATWNILQSHHATIDVNSRQGVGTSFIMSFEQED